MKYLQIFGSSMSVFIFNRKYIKLDIQKIWESIFINYTKIFKYLKVSTTCIHQVFIASKPIINQSKRYTDLLMEYLLPSPKKSFQLQTSILKTKSWSYKNIFKKRLIANLVKNGKINKENSYRRCYCQIVYQRSISASYCIGKADENLVSLQFQSKNRCNWNMKQDFFGRHMNKVCI